MKNWPERSTDNGIQVKISERGVMRVEDRPIRLVLYNTRYGTGTGWAYHAPFPFAGTLKTTMARSSSIARFIASLEPDIVGLVETDGGSFRQGGRGQPEYLAETLGHSWVFSSKYCIPRISGCVPVFRHQGNAVVTSLPIRETSVLRLKRGIKNAVIETGFDDFDLKLVHLSLGSGARRQQILELAAMVREWKRPLLIAGDFNAFGGGPEIEPLIEAGLKNADTLGIRTYPSGRPWLGLDLVLHSPEIDVKRLEVPDVRLSDHLPVVCDFALSL